MTDWMREISGNDSPEGAPYYDCPMEHDCHTDATDVRHMCHAFVAFMETMETMETTG